MGQLRGTHIPVLRARCQELLAPAFSAASAAGRRPVQLDATVGMGGHAEVMLAAHPELILIGLDRDPAALALADQRMIEYRDRVHLVQANYDQLDSVLAERGGLRLDGALFDLG